MKYMEFVRKNFNDAKFPVFSLTDLRVSLGLNGMRPAYLKRMVNYLMKKGEIRRITKGVYTFHDDITVAGFGFRPFYYGLENALTIRKLWEQNTNPVVITCRNVRTGTRKFGNGNYLINHISKEFFFGYEFIRYYDYWIPVSDYEKTLIDLVYFGHYIRDDVLLLLRKHIANSKLEGYLAPYGPRIKTRVKGLLRSCHAQKTATSIASA